MLGGPDEGPDDGLGRTLLLGRTEGAGVVLTLWLSGGSCWLETGVGLTAGAAPASAAYTVTAVPRRTTPYGRTRSTWFCGWLLVSRW